MAEHPPPEGAPQQIEPHVSDHDPRETRSRCLPESNTTAGNQQPRCHTGQILTHDRRKADQQQHADERLTGETQIKYLVDRAQRLRHAFRWCLLPPHGLTNLDSIPKRSKARIIGDPIVH
ncbi:MAG: hypothetical protein BWY82_00534 [Verrucomicrobia bacterium ADurb.Bin474]|nr:MAG: hypothetical protein BWY82_00534 [Verrucomicrobia bacterium ADurb.Bin474]